MDQFESLNHTKWDCKYRRFHSGNWPNRGTSNSHYSVYGGFSRNGLVFLVEFRFYDSVGFLNNLIGCVGRTCAGLADKRQGRSTQFSMRDIGLAGFSPFLMQCPSFLSHQRQICEGIGHGRSNCQTLLGMERIPSDNHI
jgi:hypothetical protein